MAIIINDRQAWWGSDLLFWSVNIGGQELLSRFEIY